MDLQLRGKTALVTGSTAGIGLSIAKTLAQEGVEVILNGRNKGRVDDLVHQLTAELPGTRFWGIAADFSQVDEINALLAELPQIDILINNVGIFEPQEFTQISDADWFKFFEVNVMSGVRLSRHYFPKMLASGWGRIIFVSSESALQIPTEMIHYGTTKTAQLAISRGLAELTTGTEVTVNTVLPGPTLSEGVGDFISSMAVSRNVSVEEMEKDFFQHARPTSIIKRFATTQEIANLVAYLSSPWPRQPTEPPFGSMGVLPRPLPNWACYLLLNRIVSLISLVFSNIQQGHKSTYCVSCQSMNRL